VRLTFYGCRGSCPCPCEDNVRYGGNTACVAVEAEGEDPIIFDLGTGLRFFGEHLPNDGTFRGSALVTHIHWDHVQGLPFFTPIHRTGAKLDIYGPAQSDGPLHKVFGEFMCPPYFPVHFSELEGHVWFHDVMDDDFSIGSAKVKVRPVPHVGPTVGYRVDVNGRSVAYISDHQAPPGLNTVSDQVLELADNVDVLIHDAQYTPAEFEQKATWGHCTVDYAVLVAKLSGAKKLVMFHHDPSHGDEQMDELLHQARCTATYSGVEAVDAAYEGMVIEV
jgi:phosphoribosyl 1,2-cyclic phosphodiesterase